MDVLPVKVRYEEVRWDEDERRGKKRKTAPVLNIPPPAIEIGMLQLGAQDESLTVASQISSGMSADDDDNDVVEIMRDDDRLVSFRPTTLQVHQWIAPLDSEARMLFTYCTARPLLYLCAATH